MDNTPIVIPETKEKLNRIREKFNNMNMSDDVANKVQRFEVASNVLKIATALIGITTAIDFFVPDGIPFIDEALLTTLTAALATASKIVNNKINDLVTKGKTSLSPDDVIALGSQLGKMKRSKKKDEPKEKK